MTDFLKGNTPATIYQQLLGVGGAADHAGLTASLKSVFTDDGSGASNASSFKLSTSALRIESSNQLRFRDDAIYIYSSGDTIMNLVADGEIDLATATVDINATTACTIDNTNTSNGVQIGAGVSGMPITLGHSTSETTVADNLTVTGTTAHTGVVTMATGVKLQFVDGNEYLSGNSSNLTLGASADINLTATSDVNLPASVGLTFGADTEKIEGTGSNVLALVAGGALNVTGSAASTWKTTAGTILIDSEAAAVTVDGHGGVNIAGTNGSEVDITTTGAVDINSGAFTLDGSTVSIDGTGDSNVTVTGSGKDLTLSVAGGGTQQLIMSSAGTAANAVVLESSAGGIDILASGAAGSEDIDIVATGSSVNISSSENVTDAIVLSASAGGIDVTAGSAEDIDITGSGGVNITSTENAASSIYLHADGGTSETIKIYADQGTGDDSIYVLSDVGGISIESGKTGAITNMASDSTSSITNAVIRIGTDTANCDIAIGHTTSDVLIQDNLKVAGDLYVAGAISYTDFTISKSSATTAVYDNQNHTDADGGRETTFKFTGEKGSGASVDDMAHIVVSHDGSSADEKGKIEFKTNAGSEGTSPTTALKLSADNTATFSGAIAAGTNAITCGQLNADNLTLDGNVLSSTDTNGDITLTANGTGGIMMLNTNAPGDDSISIGHNANADGEKALALGRAARASAADSVSIGDTNTASGTNSVAIGNTNTASGQDSIAIGASNTSSGSFSTALGYRGKADRRAELSFSANYFAAVGDTRCCMFHELDTLTMSSSWQSINGGTGGITFESDTVACGQVIIVGSITGAGTCAGYIIDFLAKNDGGTYSVVAQADQPVIHESDANLNAQIAIDSNTLVAQVTDSSSTNSMKWSAFWKLVQHTF